jgi:FkbH-like protein
MYYMGRFGFSDSFLPAIADVYMAYIKALKNQTRKCIVLDLDNTLWGGVLGEEGFQGIKLGKEPPGNAYLDFQRLLLSYYNRGIILAINSNNNFADAIRVIREHPYMLLREKHFAAMRINWENKAQNMIELAEEINVGLASLVFVDDMPQNREQIRRTLPEVLVVDLPPSPFLYKSTFEKLNDFNVLSLTEEDRHRGEMYYSQKSRETLRKSKVSLSDFLISLQMKIVIKPADGFSLPRIAQLVNKTNQFNLTTRRYTDIEITKMAENEKEYGVLGLSVTDRFGDEGLVGAAIIRKTPDAWNIDSFLMSCRVIGRGVETAFLAKIVTIARTTAFPTSSGSISQPKRTSRRTTSIATMDSSFFRSGKISSDGGLT